MFSAELNKYRIATLLNLNFRLSFNKTLTPETIAKLMPEVANILKSIEWNETDLDIARRRFYDPSVYKITVLDNETDELVGYALVVPIHENKWYVSQVAVMKSHQKIHIGIKIMHTILKKAEKHKVVKVKLHTEDSLLQFYSKCALSLIQIRTKVVGKTQFGAVQIEVRYLFKYWVQALVASASAAIDNNEIYKIAAQMIPPVKTLQTSQVVDFYTKIQSLSFGKLLLREFCKKCGVGLLPHIQSMSDQRMKVEFTQAAVSENFGFFISYLGVLGIVDEKDRIDILKKSLILNECIFSEFDTFGITDSRALVEIGKIAGNERPIKTLLKLHYMKIQDISDENEIIDFCGESYMETRRYKTRQSTNKWNLFIQKEPEYAYVWVPYANITDQEELFRLALGCLRCYNAQYIRRFQIKDEAKRIALFRSKPKEFYHVFDAFEIQDEALRFELACENVNFISEYVEKFKIEQMDRRVILAKLAAKSSLNFSVYVQNFNIESEEIRKELALSAAVHFPTFMCKYFKNYKITKESDRLWLAKKALENFKRAEGDFGEYIQHFEITSERDRREMAFLAAEQGLIGSGIRYYGILDQHTLFSLAQVAARTNPEFLGKYFHYYGIKDEKRRIAIAEILASNCKKFSEEVYKFFIRDQEVLKRLALQAAHKDLRFIKRFGLKSEKDRFDLALANVPAVCEYIEEFEITDQKALFQIAALTAELSPEMLFMHIAKFNFEIDKKREIGRLCARYDGRTTIENIYKLEVNQDHRMEIIWEVLRVSRIEDIYDTYSYSNIYLELYIQLHRSPDISQHLSELKKLWIKTFNTEELFDIIKGDKEIAQWLVFVLGCCYLRLGFSGNHALLLPHLKKIADFPDLQMKYKLADLLLRIAADPEQRNTFHSVDDLVIMKIKFKDPKHQVGYARGMYRILYDSDFINEELDPILDHIFAQENSISILNKTLLIETILDLGGKRLLVAALNQLETLLVQIFQSKVPISNLDNFFERFQSTFGKFRHPKLLYIYAGKSSSLKDQEQMKALATFVDWVMSDTFHEERYKHSLHLDTIFKEREGLRSEWKRGLRKPLQHIECAEEDKNTDFLTIFSDLILEHGHLNLESFPYLKMYFNKESDILKKLGIELKQMKKGSNDGYSLLFQRHFIHLMNPNISAFDQKAHLLSMKKFLTLSKRQCPLAADIDIYIKGFEKLIHNYEGWTVEDCDDPESLFTCGNVGGSCQEINGHAWLNKNLLGYVIDGKNRMVCVKNKHGELIARRIFRLLYDADRKSPVLFMEKVYPPNARPEVCKAIVFLAQERAATMQLPLAWCDPSKGSVYEGTLESLSSIAPHEYVDSATSHSSNGQYKIVNPYTGT